MIIDCLTFFAANLLDAKANEQISIDGLCSALQAPALFRGAGVE